MLYREYFQPYNEKIWKRDLTTVPLSWLEGKLPMPTLKEILYNNFIHLEEKNFVHSTFFYPRYGGPNFLLISWQKNWIYDIIHKWLVWKKEMDVGC